MLSFISWQESPPAITVTQRALTLSTLPQVNRGASPCHLTNVMCLKKKKPLFIMLYNILGAGSRDANTHTCVLAIHSNVHKGHFSSAFSHTVSFLWVQPGAVINQIKASGTKSTCSPHDWMSTWSFTFCNETPCEIAFKETLFVFQNNSEKD